MASGMIDLGKLPARFVLTGVVMNVFEAPAGTSKDGRAYGGDYRLQLLSADHLRNGETKLNPTEVNLGKERDEADAYRKRVGQVVELAVSVYVANGALGVQIAREGPKEVSA